MRYRMYRDREGLWRWNLRAPNNRILADSGESYHNKSDCRAAIHLVQGSGGTPIDEE